jgi:ribonuclease HII
MPHHPKGHWVNEVRDSKLLSPRQRQYLFGYIQEAAVSIGVGIVSHEIIDASNIVMATRLAMKQAVDQLLPAAEMLLIDYMYLPEVPLPQKGIVDGDGQCFSIACASIVAKVSRDRLMVELDGLYPGYGLAQHKAGPGIHPPHLIPADKGNVRALKWSAKTPAGSAKSWLEISSRNRAFTSWRPTIAARLVKSISSPATGTVSSLLR